MSRSGSCAAQPRISTSCPAMRAAVAVPNNDVSCSSDAARPPSSKGKTSSIRSNMDAGAGTSSSCTHRPAVVGRGARNAELGHEHMERHVRVTKRPGCARMHAAHKLEEARGALRRPGRRAGGDGAGERPRPLWLRWWGGGRRGAGLLVVCARGQTIRLLLAGQHPRPPTNRRLKLQTRRGNTGCSMRGIAPVRQQRETAAASKTMHGWVRMRQAPYQSRGL
eukprot:352902-Chlamydomonas_euryale.AAC.8